MRMALLVLDETASADDMTNAYHEVNRRMREKYQTPGITVLANDDAIRGNETWLSAEAGIRFFPSWQTNPEYRAMLRRAIQSDDKYVMKRRDEIWVCEETDGSGYEVSDPNGMVVIKPRRQQ
ncbi:MAG: hypothetical protein HYT73_00900 [Candidatus Aenigmarchaeota archaeon]|nr:hypothetical protein [Candidatus Aenigmarchaeota archaeon]